MIAAGLVVMAIFSGDPKPILPIFIALLVAVATYEMMKCIGVQNNIPLALVSYAYAVAAVALTRLSTSYHVYFEAMTFVYIFAVFAFSIIFGKKFEVDSAAMVIATELYITFGFSSMVLVRDNAFGFFWFCMIFISAWVSDTCAYFVGCAFGRHKLCPGVSPKKSVEGFFGGIIGCTLITLLFGLVIILCTEYKVNFIALALLTLIVSVCSVFGDLIASLIKRKYAIKDYGTVFPGHGGVLDRFDSILITAPVLWVLSNIPFFAGVIG